MKRRVEALAKTFVAQKKRCCAVNFGRALRRGFYGDRGFDRFILGIGIDKILIRKRILRQLNPFGSGKAHVEWGLFFENSAILGLDANLKSDNFAVLARCWQPLGVQIIKWVFLTSMCRWGSHAGDGSERRQKSCGA